jgi:23S rRNA pseudouridine2605 synthase
MEDRLQKLMSHAGLGSRRACEEIIAAGRVTVNGHVAVLGEKADPVKDRILVDGQPLKLPEANIYVAIYKPRGVLSAVSGQDPRPKVRDLVDIPGHLYPVGRLDLDSEGLILLTDDGDLANRLTHPRYGHEKEYRVLVARRPDEEQLQAWRRGVVLEDGYRTAPAEVQFVEPFGKGAWLRVIMREGRKRQIRETGAQIGLPVVKIIRTRIGSLTLGRLKPGEWRYLTSQEVLALKQPAGKQGKAVSERASQRFVSTAAAASPTRSPSGRGREADRSERRGAPARRPTAKTGRSGPSSEKTGVKKNVPGDRPFAGKPLGSTSPAGKPAKEKPRPGAKGGRPSSVGKPSNAVLKRKKNPKNPGRG